MNAGRLHSTALHLETHATIENLIFEDDLLFSLKTDDKTNQEKQMARLLGVVTAPPQPFRQRPLLSIEWFHHQQK